jgi:hypothetical protein
VTLINPYIFATGGAAPFAPDDLTDLALWLAADDITGLVDLDPVAQWNDGSTNAYHVSMATVGARPTYRTNQKNSLPAVDFDGGDWLERASVRLTNATDGTSTAFVVMKPDSVTGTRLVVNLDGGAGNRGPQMVRQEAADIQIVNNRSVISDAAGATMSIGSWYLAETIQNTGSVEALVGGTGNGSTAGALGTADVQVVRVGSYNGNFLFDGMIAEVVIYARALSGTERTDVRTYLTDKWAL